MVIVFMVIIVVVRRVIVGYRQGVAGDWWFLG